VGVEADRPQRRLQLGQVIEGQGAASCLIEELRVNRRADILASTGS
jgi:hypothetical protein